MKSTRKTLEVLFTSLGPEVGLVRHLAGHPNSLILRSDERGHTGAAFREVFYRRRRLPQLLIWTLQRIRLI